MNRALVLAAALLPPAACCRGETLLPAYHLARSASADAAGHDPLDAPAESFRAAHVPIAAAFLSVSRSYGITLVLDPAVKGDVTLEVRGGTVRDLIDAIAKSQGCFWEWDGRLIAIRRNAQRFYEIDYPQMSRSAQGSSSVVLSAQTGPAVSSNGLLPTANAAQPLGNAPNALQNDQTNLSIQQQNQSTFWTDVQSELSAMVQPGEAVSVNRLAGLAMVTAPPSRQEAFRSFIEILNRRISRQVRIAARVLEVSLDSQHQLGVDWSLAGAKAGGLTLGGLASSTGFTSIQGQTLVPGTVSGTVSLGKVSAVISALHEQGEVRAVSNPSVVSLSNQTAFVKVGTEQTFFSLANATTINALNATQGSAPYAASQNNYIQNAITIGTVLYVTPEVNGDGTVTVDVLPAITQLTGVDTSPDGQQTAPRMDIKALSTIARLHPGESVMIGGLIQDESTSQARKVPGLGEVPLIGRLFGTQAATSVHNELVIFLSAEVVP
jgi:MSHA type pilus biogenesis protein MshL